MAGGHQLLGILPVDRLALALAVRGMGMPLRRGLDDLSVRIDAFVRDDPAPVQGLDDVLLRTRHEPVGVGIFDPDDEISPVLLGIEVVIEGRPHAAHVERTSRGRGESYAGTSFHFPVFK